VSRLPVTAIGTTTTLAERKRRAGQRLIVGVPHPHVDDDTKKLVAELRPAGFCLFARNVVEPAQVRELNRELASLCDPAYPPLLTVDQEGGRVQRVRDPATVWPAMRVVGRAGDLTKRVARALALELRAMGFNLDFAPVCDVDSNPANPVIGDRSFGSDPAEVCRHVAAFVRGLQGEGVIACAKHFPGHGDTAQDSHLALPTVERDEPELLRTELPPFRAAIEAGVGTVMSAHVIFSAWDEELPATLSPRILPRRLRRDLGFDGVVFSDDLEMKAVHGRWSVEEQVRRLDDAGVDVLLACKDPKLQHDLFEELVRVQEQEQRHDDAADDAVRRLTRLRERFFLAPLAPVDLSVLARPEHRALADLARTRGA
jgi:beta-N-acetylhexosaminidase